jgi:hypothetical protein
MACGLLTGCLTGCFTGELHAQLPSLPAVPPAIQGPPLPVGAVRVISESGRVSWVRSGGDLWAVSEGDVIQPGKEIVAEADGHALLELSDHSRVEVFPNSRLTFHAGGGTWKDLLEITLGKVRIHIEKIGGLPNLYKMFSPTAIIAVRGTTFDVEVDASSTTIVEVEEGQVSVVHKLRSGKEVFLNPVESLTIYANEPIAQSQVDKVRTATKIIVNVAERVVEIMRQVAGAKLPVPGTPAGGTASTTTTTSTPTATVGTGTSAGSGTSTPPSNGRGNGSGNNGDTNPGTPVSPGTGSPGGGSTGSGGANAGSTSVGATTQSRKP